MRENFLWRIAGENTVDKYSLTSPVRPPLFRIARYFELCKNFPVPDLPFGRLLSIRFFQTILRLPWGIRNRYSGIQLCPTWLACCKRGFRFLVLCLQDYASLRSKISVMFFNYCSVGLLIYLFFRHEWYCEPWSILLNFLAVSVVF